MRCLLILMILVFSNQRLQAQESLYKDISYPYLEKLIAVCKANYPKIKMYEDRVTVSEFGVKRAKLSYFDIFSFSYLYSPTNNTAPVAATAFGGYQFGFFANIGSFLQKPSQVKQARGELAAAQHDKESFDLNIEAEVKKRYFTYLQKVAVLRIKSGALLEVENMLTDVKHRFQKGEETIDNYSKVLILHADHSQIIVTAQGDMLIAKSSLEELLGKTLEEIE